MPPPDSPAELIARFLRTNDYSETLDAFIREAALPESAGTSTGPFTLETLLEEKRTFDLSRAFEKLGSADEEGEKPWAKGAPAVPTVVDLPARINVLHTSFEQWAEGEGTSAIPALLASTADRRLSVLDIPSLSLRPTSSPSSMHESPILSCATLYHGKYLLTSSMAGHLSLHRPGGKTLSKRLDHEKYIVKIATHPLPDDSTCIATAGWDAKVQLYHLHPSATQLDAPVATITLPSNPESLAFVTHPDSGRPILIVTRRDSSFLHYYTAGPDPTLLGRQNLAPHSTAWVAFTPSAIAVCPTDPGVLAVATSAVPYMKLIITRLLLPPPPGQDHVRPAAESAAAQARAALALQDREAAAILVNCSTLAPQTAYSTPALAWRPDGSGVWVNSDDGVIKGFEAATGKLVATLKGHEAATKIRCLAAGAVHTDRGTEEWLVSGGFDQKLIVWAPARVKR